MRYMTGQTIGVLVNKRSGESGSSPFHIDGTEGGYSESFDLKLQDTDLHNVCYLTMMGNCKNETLNDPPIESDYQFGSLGYLWLLNPVCARYTTINHDGQQISGMTERPKIGDEPPKHYYKCLCSCWNMFMGFTPVSHLEKRFVEQQFLVGMFSPNSLGLKVCPICLQTLEAIMDRGDKQKSRLMEILTKHLHQLWVGNLKPLKRTARFLNLVQLLHTKHRVRVTPPPTMNWWQMNKLEHNLMLSDRRLATWSVEIDVSDTVTGQSNWSDVLKEAIDKLVDVRQAQQCTRMKFLSI